jgi:hypothetical protein
MDTYARTWILALILVQDYVEKRSYPDFYPLAIAPTKVQINSSFSVVYSALVGIPAFLAISQLLILLPCLHYALNTCYYVARKVKSHACVHVYYAQAYLE